MPSHQRCRLTHISPTCIDECVFPDAWKCALVKPLPKVSNPVSFGELRPISILPVLSKVTEKLLVKQLQEFIYDNNILPQTQSGFRKGYSCATALLTVIDDVVLELDKGNATVLCLLDYSKAFNTINHSLLRSILHHVGLEDTAVRLLHSYVVGIALPVNRFTD